jgi:hypothetical protein
MLNDVMATGVSFCSPRTDRKLADDEYSLSGCDA